MEIEKTHKACRLCLRGDDGLTHVFEKGIHGYAPADVMSELLRLEVSAKDIYPQYVCGVCLGKLRDFKKFKEQCDACKLLLDRTYAEKSKFYEDIKPNEAEAKDNLTRDDSDDERLSCLSKCEVVLGVPSKSFGEKCEVDGDLKDSRDSHGALYTNDEEGGDPEDSHDASDTIYGEGDVKWKVFTCSECAKKYLCPEAYERHMDTHKFGKTLKCSHCDKCFAHKSSLSAHMKSHSDERRVNCEICGESCRDKESLESHQVNVHGGGKRKCDICGREFVTNIELDEHKKEHDNGGGDHVCGICGKAFQSMKTFRRHKYNHKIVPCAQKKYACTVCDRKFLYQSQLVIHMRTHTNERPFPCPTCSACLRTKKSLEYHMKSKHSESGVTKVQCDDCGQRYSSVQYLQRHKIVSHMGLKEFKCELCGMEFTQKHNMTIHVKKIHSQSATDN